MKFIHCDYIKLSKNPKAILNPDLGQIPKFWTNPDADPNQCENDNPTALGSSK
jgi:hypothetical protein